MKRWPLVCVLALLFVLVACGGAAGSTPTSGVQSVQVTETDFNITASVATFSPPLAHHHQEVLNELIGSLESGAGLAKGC
jgi:hypothetical protein